MGEFIEHAILSVQSQTHQPEKIIVVDDGSTDNGPARVAALAEADTRILLLRGPNQGVSEARNKGTAAASAPYIAFLDSDDMWKPDKLERQAACLLANPAASFVHCGAEFIDEDRQPHPTMKELYPLVQPDFDAIRLGDYAVTGSASAVVARRDLLLQIEGFPLPLRRGEDWEVWARLAELGPVFAVDAALTQIRVNRKSAMRGISALEAAKARVLSRAAIAERWKDDAAFMQASRKRLRREAWYVARWLLWQPTALAAFYREMRCQPTALAQELFSGVWDFAGFLCAGLGRTALELLRPGEAVRLLGRWREERNHSSVSSRKSG
jgi:glycosyltransferase involved in cell wall biosynthesis